MTEQKTEFIGPLANRCRELANMWQQMAVDTGEHQYAGCAADLYAVLVEIGKSEQAPRPEPARTCATCWKKDVCIIIDAINTRAKMIDFDSYSLNLDVFGCNAYDQRPATGQEPIK